MISNFIISRLNIKFLKENLHRIPFFLFRVIFFKPCCNFYFFCLLYFKKYLFVRPKIENFNNQHSGDTIFILGNGPSLSQVNFDALIHEVTMASNKIFICFDSTEWRPTYYSVEDDLVFKQNLKKIKSVNSKKLFPDITILFSGIIKDVTYFNYKQKHHYPREPNFGNSLYTGIYWGSSIVYTQIQLAVAMGAKKIILLGVDFNFDVPKEFKKTTKIIVSSGEINHFHPDYRKPGELWNQPNLQNQILAFNKAKSFCDENRVEILNATKGTHLEVFKKIDMPWLYHK